MDFHDFEDSKEFQTSETIFQSDRRHFTEDLNDHQHRCNNLKYRTILRITKI